MKKKFFWYCFVVCIFLVTGGSQLWAAPVADFEATPTSGQGRLTVNFTDLSTGAIESWLWDFGDGGTSTSQNPSYQYRTVGIYTVSLTVSGSEGDDVEEKTGYITVTMGADFTTNTARQGPGPLSVVFDERCARPVDSYYWEFGDGGTSTEKDPTYVYQNRGTYTVSLTCSGTEGADTETKADYVNVSTGARIITNRQSGRIPLTVNFSSVSTTDVNLRQWDFDGDGIIDSGAQNPGDVVYDTEGTYNAKLTVTGDDGQSTVTEWIVAVNPWGKYVKKLADATPDECFTGIGERLPMNPDGTCPESSTPMTNQTYVWGLTEVDLPDIIVNQQLIPGNHSVWFGTGANVLCTTQGALYSDPDFGSGGASVCEYENSPIIDAFPPGAIWPTLGDWRPAKIYRYDLDSGQLIDRTPTPDEDPLNLMNACLGFRAAFDHNGVVILAGGTHPTIDPSPGVVMFAYSARTGAFLGAQTFPEYRTIRKGRVIQGHLYVGVGTPPMDIPDLGSGRVLRYTGNVQNPFSFVEVGNMPNIGWGGPAYGGAVRDLAEYIDGDGNSRVAASAKGVWLSPPITSAEGLPTSAYDNWELVWNPEQYEPDYVSAQSYTLGGIEFLNGWLYFMTMHMPGSIADMHAVCGVPPLQFELFDEDQCMSAYVETLTDDPSTPDVNEGREMNNAEWNAVYNSTYRATTLWRIRNAEDAVRNPADTQLLFGEANLRGFDPDGYDGNPPYDPTDPESDPYLAFPEVPTGYTPLMGTTGFNNMYNNYGWAMEKVGDHIFALTMDYSTLYWPNAPANPNDPFGWVDPSFTKISGLGFDVWKISGGSGDELPTIVPETTNAFKDFNNPGVSDIYTYVPYGGRTAARSTDGTKLFIGVASGNNLGPVGQGNGWTLLMLDSEPQPSCSWDMEPEGGVRDLDVDGLDLAAAANQPIPAEELGDFAQQFGSADCNSEAVAGVASAQEVLNIEAQDATLKVKKSKNNKKK